jgi:pyrimidine operon attenuation protein/uracil phosphoribosyltransferase
MRVVIEIPDDPKDLTVGAYIDEVTEPSQPQSIGLVCLIEEVHRVRGMLTHG